MKHYSLVLVASECSACGCDWRCAFADMHGATKKKKRTKIEKEASRKNGVMDVRGRMEEGMKG